LRKGVKTNTRKGGSGEKREGTTNMSFGEEKRVRLVLESAREKRRTEAPEEERGGRLSL